MRVLLLGASGLLGHNVLRRLVAEGYEVTALVRRADGVRLPCGGWHAVTGSPLDRDTLLAAAKGCDAIVNCVGTTDMSLLRLDDYLPANRDLPTLLVSVMEELGIRVLVHTSTVNTIGHGNAGHPSCEEAPMQAPFTHSLYALSKRAGEEVMLQAARQHADWHVVVINPGFMLGAWDVKPSSGRLLDAAYRRGLMAAPRGGKTFVAVDDVAQAMVNALTRGRNGARYILASESMSIADIYRLQAKVMGYSQRLVILPSWLAVAAGALGDVARACGIKTELNVNNVRQLNVSEHYDGGRACSELGITYTPIGDAIKNYHTWKETSKD